MLGSLFQVAFQLGMINLHLLIWFAGLAEVVALAFCFASLNVNGRHIGLNFFFLVLLHSFNADARRLRQIFKGTGDVVHHVARKV